MRRELLTRLIRGPVLVVVVVTGLTMGVAAAVVMSKPTEFASASQVLVTAQQQSEGGTPPPPEMGTEREIALSGAVAGEASRVLGLSASSALAYLDVDVKVDANVLEFTYTASTAARARDGARAFTRAYVAYRNDGKVINADVITPASLPVHPVPPDLALVLGVAGLIGAALGLAGAVARQYLSPWLRGPADVTRQTGLRVLATIPRLPARRRENEGGLVVASGGHAEGMEAFGHLAAELVSIAEQRNARTVMITSPNRRAGKSGVTANLVTALALAGQRVVVVCGDDDDQPLCDLLKVPSRPGLIDVLDDTSLLEQAIHDTDVEGLAMLPYGGDGDASLAFPGFASVLQKLAGTADLVVIDAPVVLGNTRAAVMATRADLVLLVVDARRGQRVDARAAASTLRHIGDRLVGCVATSRPR